MEGLIKLYMDTLDPSCLVKVSTVRQEERFAGVMYYLVDDIKRIGR
jgi:hypothetical protein